MRVAITSAEPLFPHQRSAIAEAFSCPVRETYGMSEGVAAASECEHGSLHVWPEAGWIEAWEDGLPAAPDRTGDLICTGLLNREMPLIRYRVGDRAAAPSYAARCPCGRTLPVIGALEGRIDDVLYTADGRRIGRLDPVFKARLPRDTIPTIRAHRLSGESRMNFVALVGHGLSALSVHAELIGVRLLVGTLLLMTFATTALSAVIGVRLLTTMAIPGWATTASGLLVVMLFQLTILAGFFVFTVLHARSQPVFIPLRDYPFFVIDVLEVYPGLSVGPGLATVAVARLEQ